MNTSDPSVQRLKDPLATVAQSMQRDALLDFSKGIGILLVVLGHTFQGQSADFDGLLGFRVIYSFHMPLFVFLSGAAAAHWIGKFRTESSLPALFHAARCRIQRSAVQLLLPFLAWTLVAYWLGSSSLSLWAYLVEVFRHADRSLWFLPCIFWCTVYASIFMFLVTALGKWLEGTACVRTARYVARLPVQILLLYIAWRCLRSKLPAEFGLVFANAFHGGLFFYYLLGVVFFKPLAGLENGMLRALPYLVFLALVPYWHRTLPHSLVADAPPWLAGTSLGSAYAGIVAIAGTLAVLDLCRVISHFNGNAINGAVAFLGAASLGIYAMHFYFLTWQPPVIAAILASLLLCQLVSMVPAARTVLLGK